MTTDILYLAYNRLGFTQATFTWMIAHTNWAKAGKVVVYDDGSEDGTLEWLREAITRVPVEAELRCSDLRSPPAIMNHYIATSQADWFVKLDNDIALPGGWLDTLAGVSAAHPEYDLIGMEAGMVQLDGRDGIKVVGHDVVEATHIGGVGLMRVAAFKERPRIPERGRFGFTEWQSRYYLRRGWITPDLLVPQLDRVPVEPFQSLSEEYVERGWQRQWPLYDEWMRAYYEWLIP
jgi:glycosyltransferase involved in cell wall biosynthesis